MVATTFSPGSEHGDPGPQVRPDRVVRGCASTIASMHTASSDGLYLLQVVCGPRHNGYQGQYWSEDSTLLDQTRPRNTPGKEKHAREGSLFVSRHPKKKRHMCKLSEPFEIQLTTFHMEKTSKIVSKTVQTAHNLYCTTLVSSPRQGGYGRELCSNSRDQVTLPEEKADTRQFAEDGTKNE